MADDSTRAELAQLRAQLAAQQEQIAGLLAGRRHPRPRHRRARFLPLALVALLIALVPMSLLAANPFTDLNGGPEHADANANIDLIYNAGITKGCTPTAYCPNDFVSREQMASFLARTAGLGTNPPVANAKTLDGKAANGLVRLARGTGAAQQALSATAQAVATVTIDAPAAGFVLVTSAVSFQTASGSNCYVETSLRHVNGDATTNVAYTFVGGGEADLASPSNVFPVAAGTQTLQLRAGVQQAGCVATAYNPVITALYVPFGPAGNAP